HAQLDATAIDVDLVVANVARPRVNGMHGSVVGYRVTEPYGNAVSARKVFLICRHPACACKQQRERHADDDGHFVWFGHSHLIPSGAIVATHGPCTSRIWP